jgi:branched-chain amino acid transport system permease protein
MPPRTSAFYLTSLAQFVQRRALNFVFLLGAIALVFAAHYGLLDDYIVTIVMLMGINIIFATSLNVVNGYMGEFSCGHAGFMCVGAYVGSIVSLSLFTGKFFGAPLLPANLAPYLGVLLYPLELLGLDVSVVPSALVFFPLVLLAATLVAAFFGLIVALPSFQTRDDYLAIITIAANFIIISIVVNIDAIGGSRGMQGMKQTINAMRKMADIPWMLIWVLISTGVCITVLYRLVSSTYGKGISAVCQNEVAAEIMGVNTNRVKIMAFMVSSGLAGLAGALYAHVYGYINATNFDILKSTEGLVMVYLGGMGSLSGVILAAVAFTLLIEMLRFIIPALNDGLHFINLLPADYDLSQVWKWVIIPLILILLMQFRPEGFLGNKEITNIFPRLKRWFYLK